jgi:hypothetical protein
MSECTLKTVIALDAETQAYKPVSHNLSAEDATNLVTEFAHKNQLARTVDQQGRHRSADAAKCRQCNDAAERATREQLGAETGAQAVTT